MFDQIFPNWVADQPDGFSLNTLYTAEVDRFISLFGNSYVSNTSTTHSYARAMYLDDADNLLLHGVNNAIDPAEDDYVLGDFSSILSSNYNNGSVGVYMVRSTVVPLPAAGWLFGSGLIGLVGFARRKKT